MRTPHQNSEFLSSSPIRQSKFVSIFLSLKNQIQSEAKNIQKEFKGLREFLDSEEKNELQKLKQECKDTLDILEDSQIEMESHRESVRDTISDLEHRLQCSAIEMLQVRLQEVQNLRVRRPGNHFAPSVLL